MSHSMTDPAGERCEHGIRWVTECPQCNDVLRALAQQSLDFMLGMSPDLVDAMPDDDRTRLFDTIDALRAALGVEQ